MLENYLSHAEGKILEFKENTKSLQGIVKTVIAFANTAGGKIIIGIKDGTKEIVGVVDVLKEEERIASSIADNVTPLLVPDIEIHSYRDKEYEIKREKYITDKLQCKFIRYTVIYN
jgi:predicted HTH transcriptional regulator